MSLTGDVLGQIGAEVSLNGGVGGSIQFTGEGTDNYDELDNRPSINGVVLTGNKTTDELHIPTGGTDDYLDLNNKPKINGVTLRGDVSSASLQIPYDDLINRPVIPDLTDLENRMDAVEGDIQSIETDIGDIGDRLIDIASDIATIQATDLVQNSDISSLKNRMNAAETSITNLGSRLTTAEGTISTHTNDISGLDTRLDTAEGNISDAQNNITDLQGDVTQLNSSLLDKCSIQYSDSANLTLTSGTSMQVLHHATLPAGKWLVHTMVRFASNGTGRRGLTVYRDSTHETSVGVLTNDFRSAVDGAPTCLKATYISEITTGNNELYVCGYQNSGSSLAYTVRVIGIKLG